MEYRQHLDKRVSHTAPILHDLPNYQNYIYAVQTPAGEAFYFAKLIFHFD